MTVCPDAKHASSGCYDIVAGTNSVLTSDLALCDLPLLAADACLHVRELPCSVCLMLESSVALC